MLFVAPLFMLLTTNVVCLLFVCFFVFKGLLMAYTVGIPILLLSLSVCGAQAKDIQIMQGGGGRRHRSKEEQQEQESKSEVDLEEENQLPFRGWAPCIFLVTFCWSGITM